jgi:hypothetical protein
MNYAEFLQLCAAADKFLIFFWRQRFKASTTRFFSLFVYLYAIFFYRAVWMLFPTYFVGAAKKKRRNRNLKNQRHNHQRLVQKLKEKWLPSLIFNFLLQKIPG